MMVVTCLLTGCVNVPVRTDRPSKSFDMDYARTHLQSTEQGIIEHFGLPNVVLRSGKETYYVYRATGDLRRVAGITMIAPPYFIPLLTWKEKNEALHCLALVFNESGLLQGYKTAAGSEKIHAGIPAIPAPVEGTIGNEENECVKALWNESERKTLEYVVGDEQFVCPGNVSDYAMSYCSQADEGIAEAQRRIGDLFFYCGRDEESGGGVISTGNLVRASVWYSLAAKGNATRAQAHLTLLQKALSDNMWQEAQHHLDAWQPGQCFKDLVEAGLLSNDMPISLYDWEFQVSVNKEAALKMLRERAIHGEPYAQWLLYKFQPTMDSISMLCRAADQGQTEARDELGKLYFYGSDQYRKFENIHIQADLLQSCMWLYLADHPNIIEQPEIKDAVFTYGVYESAEIKRTAKAMTPQQLAEAEQLIMDWKPGQCDRDFSTSFGEDYGRRLDLAGLCIDADEGFFDARDRLGQTYYLGLSGVERDIPHAYMWYYLAAKVYVPPGMRGESKQPQQPLCYDLKPEQKSAVVKLLEQWRPGQCVENLLH